jgi:hypothetical protein
MTTYIFKTNSNIFRFRVVVARQQLKKKTRRLLAADAVGFRVRSIRFRCYIPYMAQLNFQENIHFHTYHR